MIGTLVNLAVLFFVLGMLLNGLVRGGVRRLMGKPKKDVD